MRRSAREILVNHHEDKKRRCRRAWRNGDGIRKGRRAGGPRDESRFAVKLRRESVTRLLTKNAGKIEDSKRIDTEKYTTKRNLKRHSLFVQLIFKGGIMIIT